MMTLAIRNQRSRLGLKDADREQKEQEAMSDVPDYDSYLSSKVQHEVERLRALRDELVAALELAKPYVATAVSHANANPGHAMVAHLAIINAVLAKAKEKP